MTTTYEERQPPEARKAIALAQAIEAFVGEIAEDTNTNDGAPRGVFWFEGREFASAYTLVNEAKRLRALAELWTDG